MKSCLIQIWREEDGSIAFEWVLLFTLLTIGIVSGLTAARDAIVDEFGDVAEAMLALDHSFTIDYPLNVDVHTADSTTAADSGFVDAESFTDCSRTNNAPSLTGFNEQVPSPADDNAGGA